MEKAVAVALCLALCLQLACCGPAGRGRPAPPGTPEQGSPAAWEASPPPSPTETAARSGNRWDIPDWELAQFFSSVVFGADPSGEAACKWTGPISVRLSGVYGPKDSEQLTVLMDTFNSYACFPGIALRKKGGPEANLEVRYAALDELLSAGQGWNGRDPMFALFEQEGCAIRRGTVFVVTDLAETQAERNYFVTRGLFTALGFVYDSGMYEDSIFNPYYAAVRLGDSFTTPVLADWALVPMLYDVAVVPGMGCEDALNALAD